MAVVRRLKLSKRSHWTTF